MNSFVCCYHLTISQKSWIIRRREEQSCQLITTLWWVDSAVARATTKAKTFVWKACSVGMEKGFYWPQGSPCKLTALVMLCWLYCAVQLPAWTGNIVGWWREVVTIISLEAIQVQGTFLFCPVFREFKYLGSYSRVMGGWTGGLDGFLFYCYPCTQDVLFPKFFGFFLTYPSQNETTESV